MRKLLAIAWTDVRLQFTDKSEIFFFLILPALFTVILAVSMGAANSPSGDQRYPLAVVDQDNSSLSAELTGVLSESSVVRTEAQTADEASALLKDSTVPAVLTIPAGFGSALMAGQESNLRLDKAPNDTRVLYIEQEVRAAAEGVRNAVAAANASVSEAEKIRPFAGGAAKQAYFEQSLTAVREVLKNPPATVESAQAPAAPRTSTNPAEQSSAGQVVTWVSIPLIGAAAVLMDERLQGTLRRLLTTPTRRATVLGGKIAGRLGSGMVQMALLIVFGALVLHVNWGRSPLALALVMLSFGLASVAFGILLATFAKTVSQAGWLSVMFSMVFAALGGAWWPLEITPPVYQTVVQAIPTTWAMRGFTDVIVRGQGVAGVAPEVGVLLSFAVVFFAVGVLRFRYE